MTAHKILVVDDAVELLEVMRRTLSRAGYDVTACRGGSQALDAASRTQFDVALVDYRMPEIDGITVLSALWHNNPGCVRVLVSGALDVSVAVEAVNRGAVAKLMQKPYTGKEVVAVVVEAIELQKRSPYREQAELANESFERVAFTEFLGGGHLQLALQPIVTSHHDVVAYEALLRSTHPTLTGPLEVLGQAEKLGAIAELGAAVDARAAGYLTMLPNQTRLFVNVHPAELTDRDGAKRQLAPLLPFADRVVLEVTERSRIFDVSDWRAAINELRAHGFAIAVDDLGSGYNALSVLSELDPEFMKVDMSIIRDIDKDSRKRRLLELLCRFGEATGAVVVAEGIETEAEAEVVRDCGVSLFQGYYFGRPQIPAWSGAVTHGARTAAQHLSTAPGQLPH